MATYSASQSTSVMSSASASAEADLYQAADWTFFAEGGQHVICKYIGKALLLQCMLLRLRKCNATDTPSKRLMFMRHEEEYQQKVVIPLLDTSAHYVIRCILVHLPVGFVDALANAVSTARPTSRQRTPLRLPDETTTVPAQLLRDACNLPPALPHTAAAAAAAVDCRLPQLDPGSGSHDPHNPHYSPPRLERRRRRHRHRHRHSRSTHSYTDMDDADADADADAGGNGSGSGGGAQQRPVPSCKNISGGYL